MATAITEDLVTGPFRLAFPSLFKPTSKSKNNPDKLAYQATMVFKSDDPFVKEIRKLIKQAMVLKWGEDKAKWPAALREMNLGTHLSAANKDGFPIRDGRLVDWNGAGPGTVFIKATSNPDYPPKVVNQNKDDILDKSAIMSGMICRAVIYAYGFSNESQGVTFGLRIIQLVKDDGARFAGGDNSGAMDKLDKLPGAEAGADDPSSYQDDDL